MLHALFYLSSVILIKIYFYKNANVDYLYCVFIQDTEWQGKPEEKGQPQNHSNYALILLYVKTHVKMYFAFCVDCLLLNHCMYVCVLTL